MTREAELAWVEEIVRTAPQQEVFQRECTPRCFNEDVDLTRLNRIYSPLSAGSLAFYKVLADWRVDGGMPGWTLKRGDMVSRNGEVCAAADGPVKAW